MRLQSDRELETTREKLRFLTERYEVNRRDEVGDRHVRELTMRSLARLINQLKEEIIRYETRGAVTARAE